MRFIGVFLFLTTFLSATFSQQDVPTPTATKSEFLKKYEERISQTHLDGQYIPKDLPDALNELNKLTDEASRQKFASVPEEEAARKLYFSLGRWISTNWSFYEGSRLSHYLKEVGISFPDDQAYSLIVAWHRSLTKKPINFKEIRDRIVEKRKKEREEEIKKAEVIKEIKKPAPQASSKEKN